MLKRLGAVCWWLGALLNAVAAGYVVHSAIVLFRSGALLAGEALAVGAFFLVLGVVLWAACFVLAGSFWRRPHLL